MKRPVTISTRREQIRVQRVQSPLTRVGYTLPHSQAHFILLFSGSIQMELGNDVSAPRLLWFSDARAELEMTSGTRAMILSVPHVVLVQALPATTLGDQMRQAVSEDLSFSLESSSPIVAMAEGLAHERQKQDPGGDVAEQHYLGLILLHIWRLARADILTHGRAPQGIAERFINVSSQHLRDHWTVERYAAKLGISRDRLGVSVKRATGISPQTYLHRALIREAMAQLANGGASVAQISFQLGFADPAYFSRFFKRQVGQNPGAFRKAQRLNNDTAQQSFAAWP